MDYDNETIRTILVDKPHKRVTLVEEFLEFRYIEKEGDARDILDEYHAYLRLKKLGLEKYIPELYYFREEPVGHYKLVIEYIDGVKLDENFPLIKKQAFWLLIFCELAHFVYQLERNHMQHNDFHLGNILIQCDQKKKKCQVRVIDLETVTDYRNPRVYSSMVKNADDAECKRMGWSDKFHPGSDLNQIMGEILEIYHQYIPKNIRGELEPRIIRYDKEFPYAISQENPATTGKAIIELLKCEI